jgi:type I restriction enzyme S subunit
MPVALPPSAEADLIIAEVERRISIEDEIQAQVETNLRRAARLRQSILKRAFEGRLVSQDPTDEPADKLLERISLRANGTPRSPARFRQSRLECDGKSGKRTQRRLFSEDPES